MKMIKYSKKCMLGFLAVLMLGIAANAFSASALAADSTGAYTDSVELFLAGLIPEEGLTIRGRVYNYRDVVAFMEEVRWAPDDYVHKSHHCVLSELPEEDVRAIVSILRIIMNCPNTYTDYETVMNVQKVLNEEGYDCGEIDGILGVNTYTALRSYQSEHDLEIIDAVTDELLSEMGLAAP